MAISQLLRDPTAWNGWAATPGQIHYTGFAHLLTIFHPPYQSFDIAVVDGTVPVHILQPFVDIQGGFSLCNKELYDSSLLLTDLLKGSHFEFCCSTLNHDTPNKFLELSSRLTYAFVYKI